MQMLTFPSIQYRDHQYRQGANLEALPHYPAWSSKSANNVFVFSVNRRYITIRPQRMNHILTHDIQKCRQECKKSCPVVRSGRLCIEVTPESKIAFISESLCIGCGICPKKCPFGAINIINLPTNLESHVTHRYSANSFKLHRLPTPRPGQVLGLVGSNGIGKSTALKILSGKLKPNLGRYDNPPDWQDVIKYFRGSELQSLSPNPNSPCSQSS
jgi:Fe-S-cluster-containing hydrogenase component 2